jgi:hypothetical protein
MDSIFNFFYLDRIYRMNRIFFPFPDGREKNRNEQFTKESGPPGKNAEHPRGP